MMLMIMIMFMIMTMNLVMTVAKENVNVCFICRNFLKNAVSDEIQLCKPFFFPNVFQVLTQKKERIPRGSGWKENFQSLLQQSALAWELTRPQSGYWKCHNKILLNVYGDGEKRGQRT